MIRRTQRIFTSHTCVTIELIHKGKVTILLTNKLTLHAEIDTNARDQNSQLVSSVFLLLILH